jgi:hypothetical protein
MWKKYCKARQATDDNDNIIRRMRFACCITKATDTNSEYVTLTAFARQQWLHESASILRYTYIAVLINIICRNVKLETVYIKMFEVFFARSVF